MARLFFASLVKAFAARPPQSIVAVAVAVTLLAAIWAGSSDRAPGGKLIVLANGSTFDPKLVRKTRAIPRDQCDGGLIEKCIFAVRESPDRLFLIGDSHAAHWFPAVEGFAKAKGASLYVRVRPACLVSAVPIINHRHGRSDTECPQWSEDVLSEIERAKPKLVFIGQASRYQPVRPGTHASLEGEEGHATLSEAEKKMIDRIAATGAHIVMFVDTPRFPNDPLECLMNNRGTTSACRWPKHEVIFSARFPWSFSHDKPPPGVTAIDLTDQLCWDGFCYAANDSHIIMRDKGHMSVSFAASLADTLEQRLDATSQMPLLMRQR